LIIIVRVSENVLIDHEVHHQAIVMRSEIKRVIAARHHVQARRMTLAAALEVVIATIRAHVTRQLNPVSWEFLD
jgi:hypothetical protein